MEKVARIVSMEFDSKESKVETLAKSCSNIHKLAAGMELAVVVNTYENTMMGIQIWPSQEALHAFEEKSVKFFNETSRCIFAIGLPTKAMSISSSNRSSISAPMLSI